MYNVVIIDGREGSHLDHQITEAMKDASVVYIIHQDYVRVVQGEKFQGKFPDVTATFFEAITETQLSAENAKTHLEKRRERQDKIEGEDPLVKARRALEPSDELVQEHGWCGTPRLDRARRQGEKKDADLQRARDRVQNDATS